MDKDCFFVYEIINNCHVIRGIFQDVADAYACAEEIWRDGGVGYVDEYCERLEERIACYA